MARNKRKLSDLQAIGAFFQRTQGQGVGPQNGSPAGPITDLGAPGGGVSESTGSPPGAGNAPELAQKPSTLAQEPSPPATPPATQVQAPAAPAEPVDHLAAGRAKRAWIQKNTLQKRHTEFVAMWEKYGTREDAVGFIAGRMKITERKLREYARATGITVRQRARTTELRHDEDSNGPKALHKLGWNILQLFDTLLPHFQVMEELPDDENPHAEAPPDRRSTWIAWRVFLAAAFGLPSSECAVDHDQHSESPTAGKAYPSYPGVQNTAVPRGAANIPVGAMVEEIYTACTGRTDWPTKQHRRVGLMVGRRGGKSYITAVIGIFLACCREYKVNLGTKPMVMILAKDREQAGVIRGYILAFMKAVPILASMLKSDPTSSKIELINDVTIEVRAVSMGGTRGYTVVAVLMDEIAFWPTDEESARQDKKVLAALKPAMLGVKNPMIVMLSSPYARRGVLYQAHKNNYGVENAKVLVWQADTLSMRPTDEEDVVEEIIDAYNEDSADASAEYGGNFRTDLESIYTAEAIEGVSMQGRIELPPLEKHRYRGFVDPSGGSSDSYVLAIAHDEERVIDGETRTIPVLDFVKEWPAKFDPDVVSAEAAGHLKRYRIKSVIGDAYAGEWPRAPLKKRGINYELCDKNRSELYLEFLPLVNSGQVELLDPKHHKRCVNQFANLERRVGRSGKDSIDHPPGSHDDVANAVAGVIVTAGGQGYDCTW